MQVRERERERERERGMKFLANWWKCKVMQRDVHSLGALFVREMFQCREKKAKGVLRVFLSVSVTYTL